MSLAVLSSTQPGHARAPRGRTCQSKGRSRRSAPHM